jgi:hypothetical protein
MRPTASALLLSLGLIAVACARQAPRSLGGDPGIIRPVASASDVWLVRTSGERVRLAEYGSCWDTEGGGHLCADSFEKNLVESLPGEHWRVEFGRDPTSVTMYQFSDSDSDVIGFEARSFFAPQVPGSYSVSLGVSWAGGGASYEIEMDVQAND